MNRIRNAFAFGALSLSLLVSCNTDEKGKIGTLGTSKIKECARTDMIGTSQILHMGPVGVGPGSRWIKLQDDLITIAADVGDIFKPVPKEIYAPIPASGSDCSITTDNKTNLGIDLGASVATLPVSAELKTKLGNARKVEVVVDGFQWEHIKFDEYNNRLSQLPDTSPYKRPGPGRLTAIGMLKVKSYTATVDISSASDIGLSAGYTGPLPKALTGELKAGVSANITSSGKLEIKVPGETYVAGIFRPIGSGGQVESASEKTAAPTAWKVQQVAVQDSRY